MVKSILFIEDTEIPQNVATLLRAKNNAREAGRWLKTSNELLNGDTPLMRIRAGDVQSVIAAIPVKLSGMYS